MNTTTNSNERLTLSIDGMSCMNCVQTVTKALSAVPGVKVRTVAVGSAVIETVDGWTTAKAVAALEEAGYPAKATGEVAGATAPMPTKGAGGCCGGAAKAGGSSAMPRGVEGAKNSGGCCG